MPKGRPRNSDRPNGRPCADTPGNSTLRTLNKRDSFIMDKGRPCIMVCVNPSQALEQSEAPDFVLIPIEHLADIRPAIVKEFAHARAKTKQAIKELENCLSAADALIGGYEEPEETEEDEYNG